MELTFLGTASNNPSPVRGVSCTCFRFEGDVWLFDCGEGSQIQLMKSSIKPGKITKIFLTHLHGDHIFGLPGLMCTVGQNIAEKKKLEIYGPLGTRRFVRTTLELSRSMVTYDYEVHEIIPIEEQLNPDMKNWKIVENDDSRLHPSETLGRQIQIGKDGCWNLFENELISIKCSWIRHKIPCFGFVIEQKPLQGKLDVDGLKAIGLMPGPIYKKLKSGENIQLENGQTIEAAKYIGPSRPGKKLTLLGDCYELSKGMFDLAMNSDVLVHEATLEDAMQEKAISNGHSTPNMAANVANRINAKCLILSHFSQRYRPINYIPDSATSQSLEEMIEEDNVQRLVDEAKSVFNQNVIAAYDFFSFKI